MNLYSYDQDGVTVRPVAADFMKLELEVIEGLKEELEDEFEGKVYEDLDSKVFSAEERHDISRRSDIDKLRKFLEGKYIFEGGETLAAFDEVNSEREYMVMLVYSYIKSLEDFQHVFENWCLDDASIWALDISDYHIGVLNAAELFAVVNMMLENMCVYNKNK